ncbi:MAG: hypothetical protein J6S14_02065 [Clostridia bacterium]|nr:hypothetical protein [Clostridia bacterium]
MIDLENDIFSAVADVLRTAHPGVYVTGDYVNKPPSFPAVSIVENGNSVVQRYRTLNIENAVSVMYECNVYSDKASGKKSEAKAIAATLDDAFASIGFTRTMRNQVPNLNDATIYRIVCRYEAIIDKDFWIYHNS